MVNDLQNFKRYKFTITHQGKSNVSSIVSLDGSEIWKKETCSVDKFKGHLDGWLKTIPDQPRGKGYSERVAAESNSIQHQAGSLRNRRWPQGVAPLSWANNISLWDSESTKETKETHTHTHTDPFPPSSDYAICIPGERDFFGFFAGFTVSKADVVCPRQIFEQNI